MTHFIPFLAWSLGIHVATVATLSVCCVFFDTQNHPSSSPQLGNQTASLLLIGNPFPSKTLHKKRVIPDQDHPIISIHQSTKTTHPKTTPFQSSRDPVFSVATDLDPSPSQQESLASPKGESGASLDSSGHGLLDSYLAEIRSRIENCKRYPTMARRQHEEGLFIFEISIDSDGRLTRVTPAEQHGSERLASAGRSAIENASPFHRPPTHWAGGLTLKVPIRFSIQAD